MKLLKNTFVGSQTVLIASRGFVISSFLLSFLIMFPVAPAYGQSAVQATVSCEFPPQDDVVGDGDGDECVTPNNDVPKNLGNDCSAKSNTNSSTSSTSCGDPINFAIGNKYENEVDYTNINPIPLVLERFYNSKDTSTSNNMGGGWRSSYSRSINGPTPSSPAVTTAKVTLDDGRVYTFILNNSVWSSDSDVNSKLTNTIDSHGTITGWKYHTMSDDEMYDAKGRLISIVNLAGLTQTIKHDSSGRLTSVSDSFGNKLTYAYSSPSTTVIAKVNAPDGGVYSYGYDAQNNLASVTYPNGAVKKFSYGDSAHPHALTGVTDENTTLYSSTTYDVSGSAISTFLAGGVDKYTVDYSFASLGVTAYTNPLGATYNSAFQSINGVPHFYQGQVSCPNCSVPTTTNFATNDANGNLMSQTDAKGNVTTYTYDTMRNLETSRTEAYGTPQARTINTTWLPNLRLPSQITEPNGTTNFTYDSHGNLLSKTVTAGSQTQVWEYTYNNNGQIVTAMDPNGNTTNYTYDSAGNLASTTDALGHVTHFSSYDANGRLLTVIDPNGLVTKLTYDARGRLTSRTAGTEKTSYSYDAVGNLLKITMPGGSFLAYTYDAAHRLEGVKDALGNSITYTLDAAGNQTKLQTFDPNNILSRTQSFAFDDINQLMQETGAQSQTTSYAYDANGNQTSITDPLGHHTGQSYDALNRLNNKVDPNGGNTSYTYDTNDKVTSVTDPRSLQTSYSWNGLGEQTSQVSPDTGTTTKTFDAAGNVLTSTDARGDKTTYVYDPLERVTKATYSDGKVTTYQYDQGANGMGHLTKMTDNTGITVYSYDQHGRLLKQQQQTSSATLTLSYSYDSSGRVSQVSYPSGKQVAYSYDKAGQVSDLSLRNQKLISSVAYQPFAYASGWMQGNGATYKRTINQDGHITNIAIGGTKPTTLSLTYDAASQITGLSQTGLPNQTFSYDNLNRLTNFGNGATTEMFSYDADSNRTQTLTSAGTTNYTIPSTSNHLTALSGATTQTDTYDAAGNLLSDGTQTFVYDAHGRLVAATMGSVTTKYGMNGIGERVSKTAPASTSTYSYDQSGNLLGEYTAQGKAINETVWLGNIPVAVLGKSSLSNAHNGAGDANNQNCGDNENNQDDNCGNKVSYINSDWLNTPRKITDSKGRTIWTWDPQAFGNTTPNQNPSGLGTFTYNLRFPGQYFDAESGLNYNMMRSYNPMLGRYTQVDPTGLGGGINPFVYVDGNPLSRVDPYGVGWEQIPKICVLGATILCNSQAIYDSLKPPTDINQPPTKASLVNPYKQRSELNERLRQCQEAQKVSPGSNPPNNAPTTEPNPLQLTPENIIGNIIAKLLGRLSIPFAVLTYSGGLAADE